MQSNKTLSGKAGRNIGHRETGAPFIEKENRMIIRDVWTRENMARLETIYHTANGYLGVRNSPEEGSGGESIRGQYVNGIYETMTITYGEKLYGFPDTKQTLCNVPDAQTLVLEANGLRYSMFDETVQEREQSIDTHTGISERSALWHHPDGDLRIRIQRIASFSMPNLFLMRLSLIPEGFGGSIRILSSLKTEIRNHANANDPRVAAEPLRCFRTEEKRIAGNMAVATLHTLKSGLTLAAACAHQGMEGAWQETEDGFEAVLEGEGGKPLTLDKFTVYTDSVRSKEPEKEALQLLKKALVQGGDCWLNAQKETVSKLADSTYARLNAPSPLPQALEYDLFELVQSTSRDGAANVAAKGLSGEGYEGHTFWDSEIYVFPYFLWTQSEVARQMLTWRWRLLPKAREIARTLGMKKGALYPWRTINGEECSAFFPAGTAQYHIDGDIAYAFLQYWHVTGDLEFMAEMGAEVLVETARMWLELGHMQDGRFRIDCVTGPDEYTCCVNNNFYTNAVAQYNLRGAAEVLRVLQEKGMDAKVLSATGVTVEERAAFMDAAQAMLLPYDEGLGISMQDDSFLKKKKLDFRLLPKSDFPLLLHYHPLFLYRHQVCKQADTVLAHLLFPETASELVRRKSFEYYDQVTTHDSSLSVCVFATLAARLGMMDRARQGFEDTATLDLCDTHGNTRDGLHTASLGGAYLAMLLGFAGVHAGADGLSLAPVLPEEWDGYCLPVTYRGRRLEIAVSKEEKKLRLVSGEPLEVTLFGQKIMISSEAAF